MAEITTTQTMGNKTITTTINTAARGPAGSDATVTAANVLTAAQAMNTEQEADMREAIGSADQFNPLDAPYLAAFWSDSSENLKLAISQDGKSFSQFATNLTTGPNNTVRDPSIIFHKGLWYCAFTNNSFNTTTTFSIYRSRDLLTWTALATVSLSSVSGLNRVWSPQLFVGSDGAVRAYVAGNDGSATDTYGEFSIYHLLGSNDLTSWGAPTAVLSRSAGTKHYIDPWVIEEAGTFYLFAKEEYSNYIEVATSTSAASGFSLVRTGYWAGWGAGIEGTIVLKTATGFRFYVDRYAAQTSVGYDESTALLSGWSGTLTTAHMEGSRFRHGSIYPLATTAAFLSSAGAVMQASASLAALLPYGSTRTARGSVIPNSLKVEANELPAANFWAQIILSHVNGTGTYKGAIFIAYNDQLQICRGINADGVADPSVVMVDVTLGTRLWDFKAGLKIGGGATWTTGTGTPEGAVTAPAGSLFSRTNGGANTTLYVKESGTGNTGWAAK
jgi:hypothetical protein